MATPHPYTDEALAEWAKRRPDLALRTHTDPGLHRHFHVNRVVLSNVEKAMEAEGVAADVRRRVVNTAVFGAPDPDEALTTSQMRRLSDLQKLEGDVQQVRVGLLDDGRTAADPDGA